MAVSKEDVRNLLRIFEQSDWEEMRVEVEGLKLTVSKSGKPLSGAHAPAPAPMAAAPAPAPSGASVAAAVPGQSGVAAAAAPLTLGPGQMAIKAPNLGVFWRQPKPGAPAYVQEGQDIDVDTTVCLIEVMKLFTPVKAGMKGRIVRCLVQDGQMVEHDTPLFVVQQ